MKSLAKVILFFLACSFICWMFTPINLNKTIGWGYDYSGFIWQLITRCSWVYFATLIFAVFQFRRNNE